MKDNSHTATKWYPDYARRMLAHEGVDPKALLAKTREMLQPVNHGWLARRLEALWNSTSHAGTMKAADWLGETGRLLADVPLDILQVAIDEAVKRAERGFMPSVGEIRAIADPLLDERKVQERRLAVLADDRPAPAAIPYHVPERWRPKPGETAAILAEHGVASSEPERRKSFDGPPLMPTRADYIAMGVDPAVFDQSKAA